MSLCPHVLVSSCPEEFGLWAPGDHEEAAGEAGSQQPGGGFRGGVVWRRQRALSSAPFWSATQQLLFVPLFVLRQRLTEKSLWGSCGAGRNSSAHLPEPPTPGLAVRSKSTRRSAWRSQELLDLMPHSVTKETLHQLFSVPLRLCQNLQNPQNTEPGHSSSNPYVL